jgi:hypothetical protein
MAIHCRTHQADEYIPQVSGESQIYAGVRAETSSVQVRATIANGRSDFPVGGLEIAPLAVTKTGSDPLVVNRSLCAIGGLLVGVAGDEAGHPAGGELVSDFGAGFPLARTFLQVAACSDSPVWLPRGAAV